MTATPPVLVLVRGSSPFLPNAVLAQREHACLALAADLAGRTELVERSAESPGGPLDRLCRRAEKVGARAVVTWNVFGLVASADEAAAMTLLIDSGVTVYEASSGALVPLRVDRLSAAVPGRARATLEERQLHAARTRQGRKEVARQGRWLGGRRPLGWVLNENGDAELDVTAAGHIRSGTRRVAAGSSIGTVVAIWNNAGFTTLTGRPWTFGSARRVLLRARNAGLVEYRGEIVGRSEWPAIVTVQEWSRARERIERRRKQQTA